IRHQVIQGESIMTGDEIDAVRRQASCLLVEVRASCNAGGDRTYHPWIASDKATDRVTVVPVPLGPAIDREVANLVEATGVPRLSDEFGIGEPFIQLNMPKSRRVFEGSAISTTSQNRGLIQAESIYMHLFYPVLQAFCDQLGCDRVVALEGVSAPTIIGIISLVIGIEAIIDTVVDPLETDRGVEMIAFAGMVKDDI